MILNTFLRDDDFWHGRMLDYITKRNWKYKRYAGFDVLNITCGVILYQEQVDLVIMESSHFDDEEARVFRLILKEGKKRKVASWKLMYITRMKNIFNNKKDVNNLLNAIEEASRVCESGVEAQNETQMIYHHAYFMANHPSYYKENTKKISRQIELFAKYGVDIAEDFITFENQVSSAFNRQFDALSDLFFERTSVLKKQRKLHSALESSRTACVFDHFINPASGQTYLKLLTAQLSMYTGDLRTAKNICNQTLKAIDPENKNFETEQKDILEMLDMINGEMWKENNL